MKCLNIVACEGCDHSATAIASDVTEYHDSLPVIVTKQLSWRNDTDTQLC